MSFSFLYIITNEAIQLDTISMLYYAMMVENISTISFYRIYFHRNHKCINVIVHGK